MNKLLLFLVFSFTICAPIFSTPSDIEEIKTLYYQISEKISEGKHYYITEVNVNRENMSYPAVGVYNSLITYYWDYQAEEVKPQKIVKIIMKINRAAYEEYYEFLLNREQEIIFCMTSGLPNTEDQRFYFKDSKLIRYIVGENIFDSINQELRDNAKTITEISENMIKLFTFTFY